MIEHKIPILDEESGEITQMKVEVDTSLYSQMRWEKTFPEIAKTEDIFDFTQRLAHMNIASLDASKMLPRAISLLKPIYCFVDSSMAWDEFVKQFKICDSKYFDMLVQSCAQILKYVLGSSSEKN